MSTLVIPNRSIEPPEEQPISIGQWREEFYQQWTTYRQRAIAYDVTLPDGDTAATRCMKETDLPEIEGDKAARLWLVEHVVDYILG